MHWKPLEVNERKRWLPKDLQQNIEGAGQWKSALFELGPCVWLSRPLVLVLLGCAASWKVVLSEKIHGWFQQAPPLALEAVPVKPGHEETDQSSGHHDSCHPNWMLQGDKNEVSYTV